MKALIVFTSLMLSVPLAAEAALYNWSEHGGGLKSVVFASVSVAWVVVLTAAFIDDATRGVK